MKMKYIIMGLFMFLLIRDPGVGLNKFIHDASHFNKWEAGGKALHPGFSVVEIPGNSETFSWPNGSAGSALLTPENIIVINPAATVSTRNADRASGLDKLKGLGLTQDEIDSLFR